MQSALIDSVQGIDLRIWSLSLVRRVTKHDPYHEQQG